MRKVMTNIIKPYRHTLYNRAAADVRSNILRFFDRWGKTSFIFCALLLSRRTQYGKKVQNVFFNGYS